MTQEWKLKDYLGDGVYAMYDGYAIWLHANDPDHPTDRICLEPAVIEALNRFIKRCAASEPGKDITNIPTAELEEDLHESLIDIAACGAALALGIKECKGESIQEHHDTNLKIVEEIELELARRKEQKAHETHDPLSALQD